MSTTHSLIAAAVALWGIPSFAVAVMTGLMSR